MSSSNSQVAFTPGSGANIATHSFTEDGSTRHVERFAPGAGLIDMPDTAQISASSSTGLQPTSAIDCTGKGRIVIASLFSVDEETADFRIAFYDSESNLIGYTEELSFTNTSISDGTSYYGELLIIANEFGAKEFKLNITTAPATGTVSITCGVL